MNTFRSFFFLEYKRFLSWRNKIALVAFFVLALVLIQVGISQYKHMEQNRAQFQEAERLKVKEFMNYEQYGGYGFGILFMPSPLSTFFNNTNLFTELASRIDVAGKLTIYNSMKGKNIFAQKPGQWLDFAEIILLFGSFMALFFGYDSLRHKEYVKYLSTLYDYQRVFWNICLSRVILFCLFFIALTAWAVTLLFINGVWLTYGDWGYWGIFLLMVLLLMVFFFSLGTMLASIKSKIIGLLIFLIWFLSVYLIPGVINKGIEAKSNSITSNYLLELEKLRKLMNFEREAQEKMTQNAPGNGKEQKESKENPGISANENPVKDKISIEKEKEKVARERAEIYREGVFPEIQKVDEDLLAEMEREIEYLHHFSIIFPTTFYLSANKEISSRGYKNVIAFYKYAIKTKEQFMDFYKKKRYPDKDKPKTPPNPPDQKKQDIESFFKGDENIFMGKSGLPYHFAWGILATCWWIVLLFVVSYSSYIKSLFRVPKKKVIGLDELEIKLTGGESDVVLSRGKNVYNHFYNVLYGKNQAFKGKIFHNGNNIARENSKKDFLYLCHSEDIPPYIKTGDFVSFMARAAGIPPPKLTQLKKQLNLKELGSKYFKELEKKDKGQILLEMALLKKSKVYLIYDFAEGMPPDFFKGFINRLEELKKEGAAIIYLTDDIFLARKIGDTISVLKKDAILMSINI